MALASRHLPEFNLDEEVRLFSTNADRDHYENLANLFGLIVSLDYLERAYVRDSVSSEQYGKECTRLLAQYKTVVKVLGDNVPSLEAFVSEYRMDCTAAVHRLRIGVPATVEHAGQEAGETSKWIAETTQNFITLLDALKLKMRAKDQLHPIMTELMSGYSKFPKSSDFEGRPKLVHWLIALNQMKASDELSEDQVRQMAFDVEQAYTEFFQQRIMTNLSAHDARLSVLNAWRLELPANDWLSSLPLESPEIQQHIFDALFLGMFENASTILSGFLDAAYRSFGCETALKRFFFHCTKGREMLPQCEDIAEVLLSQQIPKTFRLDANQLFGCLRLLQTSLMLPDRTMSRNLVVAILPNLPPAGDLIDNELQLYIDNLATSLVVSDVSVPTKAKEWVQRQSSFGREKIGQKTETNPVSDQHLAFYAYLFDPAHSGNARTKLLQPSSNIKVLPTTLISAFLEWSVTSALPGLTCLGLLHCKVLPVLLELTLSGTLELEEVDAKNRICEDLGMLTTLHASDRGGRLEILAQMDAATRNYEKRRHSMQKQLLASLDLSSLSNATIQIVQALQDPLGHESLSLSLLDHMESLSQTPGALTTAHWLTWITLFFNQNISTVVFSYVPACRIFSGIENFLRELNVSSSGSASLEQFGQVYVLYLQLCSRFLHIPRVTGHKTAVHLKSLTAGDANIVDAWLAAFFSDGIHDELTESTKPFELLRLAPTIVLQAITATQQSYITIETLREAMSYLNQDLLVFNLPNVIFAVLDQCESARSDASSVGLFLSLVHDLLAETKEPLLELIAPSVLDFLQHSEVPNKEKDALIKLLNTKGQSWSEDSVQPLVVPFDSLDFSFHAVRQKYLRAQCT